jgi:hypothetical protein
MKTNLIILGIMLFVITSCGSKNSKSDPGGETTSTNEPGENFSEDDDFKIGDKKWTTTTGTFSLGKDAYTGKTFTQQVRSLANVGCEQQSDPFTILTISLSSFDAKGDLKISGNVLETGPGEVFVNMTGGHSVVEYHTTSASTGTVNIAGNIITIKDLKVFNMNGAEKVLNATVNF